MMNTQNLTSRLRATGLAALAATAAMGAMTAAVHAGGIERLDMKPEGIDLAQLEVHANASGYTGTVTKSHMFMLRLYAKTHGNHRVYQVKVNSPGKPVLFERHVGKSEGWAKYAQSINMHAKINNVNWALTPKQACDLMLKNKVKDGMPKAKVLSNDRKTTAIAEISFTAYSDTKANNEKNKRGSFDSVEAIRIPYRVNVVCRAAL